MTIKSYFILQLVVASLVINFSYSDSKIREETRTISFDENWSFIKDSLSGAEDPSFDDAHKDPIIIIANSVSIVINIIVARFTYKVKTQAK